jgi:hypothetical protein
MKGFIKRLLREGLESVNYLHIDDVDDDNDYEHYLVEDKNESNILVNNFIPERLKGAQIEANIIGRNRLCVKGKIELSSIDIVLDNGLKTAMDKLSSDKSFKVSKSPIVIGVDINNGKTQLLDGYHRYVYNKGNGILPAYFIPMRDGDIIDFSEI